jgi:hypothetical protein
MLIASDGLLQNQGFVISGNLTIAINSYNSTDAVGDYLGILSSAFANVGVGNDQITTNTFSSLQTLAANTFPAITDAVPAAYTSTLVIGNSTAGFSGLVSTQANLILGDGDISKFVQTYGIVQSYIVQNNQYINTVKNSEILAPTFSTMDALTTGSLGEINRNLPVFGADLTKLGTTWSFANLSYFGYPWVLLRQVITSAGILPELTTRLNNNGVTQSDISSILQDNAAVSPQLDAAIYRTMQGVTGDLLDQIKLLLDVTTPNLTTMADLLNPVKTLPNSYLGLTALLPTGTEVTPTDSVLANVYLSANTVNSNFLRLFAADPFYQDLALVIPPDQALANKAIASSLGQVKNILSLRLPALAAAVTATETNAGLSDITSLTTPVPAGVSSSLNNILATGSGPNGTLTLFDFMGATAGVPYTAEFTAAANTINTMQAANALYTLTDDTNGVYVVMQDTLNGDYTVIINPGPPAEVTVTIPPGLPGAGTYLSLDEAFTVGLLPAAANLIANIVANNTSEVTSLNSNFNTMALQLNAEVNNLAAAQVDFGDLTANSRSSLLSFGTSLHQIGADIEPAGKSTADFFTAIADTSNIYGQAILASFREGRNIDVLNAAGIGSDTQIPGTGA